MDTSWGGRGGSIGERRSLTLVEITDVNDCEVLDALSDTEEDFILAHAVGVPVTAESDDYQTLFFGEDGLVNVPACCQVGEHNGAHFSSSGFVSFRVVSRGVSGGDCGS
jgi:hypothetical protein